MVPVVLVKSTDMNVLKALLLFLALHVSAFAQPCLPATEAPPGTPHIWQQPPQNVEWIGSPIEWGISTKGAWLRWYCGEVNGPGFVPVTRVSLPSDWANIGGRVRTIMLADDPLRSLQTVPNRIKMLHLTDPAFAELLKEIK